MLEVNNVCVSFRSERQEKIFGTARNQVLFDVSLKVGAMIKKVRKRASPTSTWLGGAVWVPIAERVKCSTIIILVKEVSIIRMEGASAITVNTKSICNTLARSLPFPADIPIVKLLEPVVSVSLTVGMVSVA